MILGHSELKKLIKSDNLITGLSDRDEKSPEGCDIRETFILDFSMPVQ